MDNKILVILIILMVILDMIAAVASVKCYQTYSDINRGLAHIVLELDSINNN